jgi:beta-glucosidase
MGAPIGRRELGETHLRPAHAAARVGVAGFMAAYNDVDGVPCSANEDLLTGTIREQWGWDGVVMADGTAIDRLRDSSPDPAFAAALALRAGVDLSLWDDAFTHLEAAIDRGLVAESALDRAADRVLALKRRLGLFGDPVVGTPVERDVVTLVDRAARQSVVLVDDGGLLPLPDGTTVAVVGPSADDLEAQLGDYTPPRPVPDPAASTVRSALVARFGEDRVRHARGSDLRGALDDPRALDAVRAASAGADVCVAVLGGSSRRTYTDEFADNGAVEGPASDTTNGEGVDLSSVALPAAQLAVVRAAREAGTPVIGVVIDGRPRVLTELRALVDALVVVPFPGPSGGAAVVSALCDGAGSGRLPATFPAADGAMPAAHDERMETARGYVDADVGQALRFGTAQHRDVTLRLVGEVASVAAAALGRPSTGSARRAARHPAPDTAPDTARRADVAHVTVEVTNTGADDVALSVPLYGRRHEPGVRPRRRQLLAVERTTVPAGGSTTVTFELGIDELGSWATGEPVAAPVVVSVWCTPEADPPEGAPQVRVTDEKGTTPWER